MKEPTFSKDTMTLKGPMCDGSTMEIYCDVWCAEDSGEASEDSLFEVNPESGDTCAFCGKQLHQQTEAERYNREMDVRNRIAAENREKPWLPLVDGE